MNKGNQMLESGLSKLQNFKSCHVAIIVTVGQYSPQITFKQILNTNELKMYWITLRINQECKENNSEYHGNVIKVHYKYNNNVFFFFSFHLVSNL